jgi:G protein beta subunit-like protein
MDQVPDDATPMRSVSVAVDGSLLCAGNNKGHVYIWRMLPTHRVHLTNSTSSSGGRSLVNGATTGSLFNGSNATSASEEVTWDLQPVTKIQAHGKYLLRCLLSPDVR